MKRHNFMRWQAELLQQRDELLGLISREAREAQQAFTEQTQANTARLRSDRERTTKTFQQQYDQLQAEYQRLLGEYQARGHSETKQLLQRRDEQAELTAFERSKRLSGGEYDWFLARQRVRRDYEQQKKVITEAYQQAKLAWRGERSTFLALRDFIAEVFGRYGATLPDSADETTPESDDIERDGIVARAHSAGDLHIGPRADVTPELIASLIAAETADADECEVDECEVDAIAVESPAAAVESTSSDSVALSSAQATLDYQQKLASVRALLLTFQKVRAVRVVEDRWAILLFIVTAVIGTAALGFVWGWGSPLSPIIAGLLIGVAIAFVAAQYVRIVARRTARGMAASVANSLADTQATLALVRSQQQLEAEQAFRALKQDRRQALATLDADWKTLQAEIQEQFRQRTELMLATVEKKQSAIAAHWSGQIQQLHDHFRPQLQQLETAIQEQLRQLDATSQGRQLRSQQQYDASLRTLDERSRMLREECELANHEMQQAVDSAQTDCEINWQNWQPSKQAPLVLPLGHYDVDGPPTPQLSASDVDAANMSDGGSPVGFPDLASPSRTTDVSSARQDRIGDRLRFPVALNLPEAPSLLLEADGVGRQQAMEVLRLAMLRLLVNVPPGKVRFTIIDPVGLGQNFSAFMHLADYDERLVGHRIWTETNPIQQRLAELCAHLENVIQTYLRNEFQSIQQYNAHAGEIAEPFHVLVVANFPTAFSEEASRRLASIAASGARCGVYTLISTDSKLPLPKHFDLQDLRANANALLWEEGSFRCQQAALRRFAVQWDPLPTDGTLTRCLHRVGELSRDASRVEVPFASVAPRPEDCWMGDSRTELCIPVGRAGAAKLQYLTLGKGTSQHVLISGKTGSGKSTLLHAIITNAALRYSPQEVQFYLIDFKKGVEFKAYAQHRLPHARVIAIESEREFGLSVLERLDVELRRRGDLFRRASVQSLAGYRDARPDELMPRILLVIDEFQEFFVKEDKISHDAALLLDRLVRQGRAFGIHVLLGSQTLAGAYSLARSTIGQMAVRIALPCSSTDAHLILSEENDAARLLRRPGEAIYNDANGMIEGNRPFQVVWLPDHERETYLQQMAITGARRNLSGEPAIVFEGNIAANASANRLLQRSLVAPRGREVRLAPRCWLGEAISIKEPPASVFHRRQCANLLLVGQREESALGILANAVIALGAFTARDSSQRLTTKFVVLDGARPESDFGGFWNSLATQLPLDIQVIKPRDVDEALASVYREVEHRQASDADVLPPVFLIVHDLARFRTLQRGEEQFGFRSIGTFDADDEPQQDAAVDVQFARIMKDGPPLGVHTLLWADSYISLNRWIERQTMADLAYRVLFQMSATDSSNLMDSPAAAHLGPHRALFYNEDQGTAERFRPYGLPDPMWLGRVGDWLRQSDERRSTAIDNDVGDRDARDDLA